MDKAEAIKLLGGTPGSAAAAIGISPQAVSAWPPVLTRAIADRVQAALWRMQNEPKGALRGGVAEPQDLKAAAPATQEAA